MSKSSADMKHIAAMLVCPHQWGKDRNVTLVDGKKRRKGVHSVCAACGTNRVTYPDGTATMFPPDGISSSPGGAP
jgi:hypothetical protein